MDDELLFDWLQDGRITHEEYLDLTKRRFTNIRAIRPRQEVESLLLAFAEIDRMRAKPNSPEAA